MASLPPNVRLTFMGLWGLADDDGYFEWKPGEIAAELYRYANTHSRERQVEAHLAALVGAGPVKLLECGVHGVIPSMPNHRIQSGRHTFGTAEKHRGTCLTGRGTPRNSASRSYTDTGTYTETVSNGAPSAIRKDSTLTPFREAMVANGLRPELVGKR